MDIIEYSPRYQDDAAALMAELQDVERALRDDRVPGAEIGREHFGYLLAFSQANEGKIFLAVEDDRAVGFIVVWMDQEDDGDIHLYPELRRYGIITDLVVTKDKRRAGIAQALMAAAEQHCKQVGVKVVKITVLNDNQGAQNFYRHEGYQPYEVIYQKSI